MRKRNLVGVLGTFAVTAALVVGGGVTPAQAVPPLSGTQWDYTDPSWTGTPPTGSSCATSAYPIKSYSIVSPDGYTDGLMEVMYSPYCTTNWVRIYNYDPGTIAWKDIQRDPWLPGENGLPQAESAISDAGTGWSYGMQLWAPGCIYVEGVIYTSAGAILADSQLHELC